MRDQPGWGPLHLHKGRNPASVAMKSVVMKERVAAGLAEALLASEPDRRSAREGCARALGRNHRWLGPLVARLLNDFGVAWHTGSRQCLVTAIMADKGFASAWDGRSPPRLRNHSLASPAMVPRPDALQDIELPDLPTHGDIARWLDVTPRELDWFSGCRNWHTAAGNMAPRHYVCSWIPKRSGGFRLIESPKKRLRELQRRILHGLLDYVPTHESVHGFRTAHSPLTNATVHVGRRIVVRMDLENFFMHVGGPRVAALFRTLGYPEQAVRALTGLCTNTVAADCLTASDVSKYDFELPQVGWRDAKRLNRPHLPQGAPTSPALANLCAFRLDMRLQYAAEAAGAVYTRYADDLTFSGDAKLSRSAGRFISFAASIAIEEGFAVNFRKTKIMRSSTRQRVTGIVVNEKPNLPRDEFDVLKATLNNCVRHGPASQNRDGHRDYRAHLAGRVAHAGLLNPGRGMRLKRVFDEIRW